MKQQIRKRMEGFTIIEVLIVLAIAGLIMLVVFLAVPALQRNSRNTQRTSDASLIAGAVNECLANKNGLTNSCDQIPPASTTEVALDAAKISMLKNDDGTTTNITFCGAQGQPNCPAFGPANGTAAWNQAVQIRYRQRCTDDGSNVQAGTARQFALVFQVENAQANGITRCIDS